MFSRHCGIDCADDIQSAFLRGFYSVCEINFLLKQIRLIDAAKLFGGDRCFGIAANMDFILVCTYEEDGKDPELVLYKKR